MNKIDRYLALAASKKMTVKQIETMCDQLIAEFNGTVKALEGQKTNPSVAENYWQAVGAREVMKAFRQAINGSKAEINIYLNK